MHSSAYFLFSSSKIILQHVFKGFLYLSNIYFNLHIPTYIENLPCHPAVLHGPFGKPDYLKAILCILTSMYFPPNLHFLILFLMVFATKMLLYYTPMGHRTSLNSKIIISIVSFKQNMNLKLKCLWGKYFDVEISCQF